LRVPSEEIAFSYSFKVGSLDRDRDADVPVATVRARLRRCALARGGASQRGEKKSIRKGDAQKRIGKRCKNQRCIRKYRNTGHVHMIVDHLPIKTGELFSLTSPANSQARPRYSARSKNRRFYFFLPFFLSSVFESACIRVAIPPKSMSTSFRMRRRNSAKSMAPFPSSSTSLKS